jgi:ribosomal protein S18 acetylase RimI-like enzyme
MLVEGRVVQHDGFSHIRPSAVAIRCQDAVVPVLDNPVWHALSGPQATLAEGNAHALRFDPAFAPFAAIPDEPNDQDWAALGELIGPGGMAIVIRDVIAPPPEWETLFAAAGAQMVWDGDDEAATEPGASTEIKRLTAPDEPEMRDLVERTEPGPWFERTIELGTYLGIRSEGALVAMAGMRMHLPGYTEISAVCTDEAHRGRGLAAVLVRALVREITARGETPCLHAVADNFPALRLYERLGFTLRRELPFAAIRPRSPSAGR